MCVLRGLYSVAFAFPGSPSHYNAAVVGAGPAGLAILSSLLDCGQTSILWMDPHFNAGRLSTYIEVPSNTKVKLFQQYVTTSPSLNRFAEKALAQFEGQDPDRGCSLALAVRMVQNLTDSIKKEDTGRVQCVKNILKELRYSDGTWHLDTGETADQVYLATGSRPRKIPKSGVSEIDLDIALKPSELCSLVSHDDTIGVVGSSHSAMLALKNLVDCKIRPKQIINFYRSPLLYAQYMDTWILYDNTGLKGEVAEWSKQEIDTGRLEDMGLITRVCVQDCSQEEQLRMWGRCTKLVQAVGYDRNELPRIVINGEEVVDVAYDPLTGRIADGLFGYGIAFPEQTTDPYGNRELAVGLWKFMRYIRATVENHVLQIV